MPRDCFPHRNRKRLHQSPMPIAHRFALLAPHTNHSIVLSSLSLPRCIVMLTQRECRIAGRRMTGRSCVKGRVVWIISRAEWHRVVIVLSIIWKDDHCPRASPLTPRNSPSPNSRTSASSRSRLKRTATSATKRRREIRRQRNGLNWDCLSLSALPNDRIRQRNDADAIPRILHATKKPQPCASHWVVVSCVTGYSATVSSPDSTKGSDWIKRDGIP